MDLVLGPGANPKRNPLCGRNFEYFSEDPYLAGKLAAGFIRGMEGGGARNAFLNHLTEEATGKEVVALPIEATALGNLKIQMEAVQ